MREEINPSESTPELPEISKQHEAILLAVAEFRKVDKGLLSGGLTEEAIIHIFAKAFTEKDMDPSASDFYSHGVASKDYQAYRQTGVFPGYVTAAFRKAEIDRTQKEKWERGRAAEAATKLAKSGTVKEGSSKQEDS